MKGYSFRSLTDLVLKIFKTKVNAGTGLSGGGSLEADRTLTVVYGTAAGTSTQGNDSRLSNSRDWSAETISQVETEAGTATTRRAFTAQRVRQAIIAWWNSITGAFGRDLVTSDSNSVARSKLGLHTSATRWPSWSEVTSKPTTFSPSSHTHPWNQVTEQPATATRWPTWAEVSNKPANYPTTWDSVAAKPAQATRWPTFAEVTGKPSTYDPSAHTHPHTQVTGLGTAATRDIGTRSGNVMEVGAFGIGVSSYVFGDTLLGGGNRIVNRGPADGDLPNVDGYSDRSSVIVLNSSGHRSWIQVTNRGLYYAWSYSPASLPSFTKALSANDLQHTTGQSTQYPMTQKAVTDELYNKANTSTQVIAGTGLSGGGNLSANRTLSVNYGTTAGTAAQGNDSRINNGQTAFGWGNHAAAGYVKTAGDQTIGGTKTFSTFPVTPPSAPTANYQVANKKYVDDSAIGVGQTWRDVITSRVLGTTYTNTSGRPIYVSVSIQDNIVDGIAAMRVLVGGVVISRQEDDSIGRRILISASFIVPPGMTYRVSSEMIDGKPANDILYNWAELR